MDETPKKIRICALCRHLETVQEGREFAGLPDTAYMVFRCRILDWSTREDYLMESDPVASLEAFSGPAFECPHWQA